MKVTGKIVKTDSNDNDWFQKGSLGKGRVSGDIYLIGDSIGNNSVRYCIILVSKTSDTVGIICQYSKENLIPFYGEISIKSEL